jgi:hypothetical protein
MHRRLNLMRGRRECTRLHTYQEPLPALHLTNGSGSAEYMHPSEIAGALVSYWAPRINLCEYVHARARSTTMRDAAVPGDVVPPPANTAGVSRTAASHGTVVNMMQRPDLRSWCLEVARDA